MLPPPMGGTARKRLAKVERNRLRAFPLAPELGKIIKACAKLAGAPSWPAGHGSCTTSRVARRMLRTIPMPIP